MDPLLITTLSHMIFCGSQMTFRWMDIDNLLLSLMPVLYGRLKKGSRYLYVSRRSFNAVFFQDQDECKVVEWCISVRINYNPHLTTIV